MFKYTNAFTNRSGDSLPGYFARLYDSGGNLVSIYADASETPISTVSGVANAALSDENGMFRWYCANGTYDIVFSDANDQFVSREPGVPMFEASGVYDDLSASTGAALVGATSGTVQASLNARPTSATLAASGGAALVGFIQSGTGAVSRTTQDKERDIVSVVDFGADPTGVANSTTAIQAAIDTDAKEVFFPKGNYLHGNLTCDNDYQRFVGPGARLVRNANSTTITVSARGNQFQCIRFSGGSFTGNNLTITGPEATFQNCDSIETQGRALYADSDGGNLLINGGVWATTDVSGSGYDIELHDDTPGTSLYSKLIGISTNASTGGVLIDGQGTVRILGCQIGKLTVTSGGGMFEGNRFNGAVSIQASSNQLTNNAFAGNVTFGDGAGGNIGNIAFDSTNMMQTGTTLTISSDVVESSFHLGQLANVTLVINGPNNDIWHGRIAYTPTLGASGGSPALGNGSLTGGYSRNGRDLTVDVTFVGGSTTNYGTGQFYVTLPYNTGRYAHGSGVATEDGARSYSATALAPNGDNKVYILMADTDGSQNAGATYPFTWGDQDRFGFEITSSYSA